MVPRLQRRLTIYRARDAATLPGLGFLKAPRSLHKNPRPFPMELSFPIPAGIEMPELAEGETIDFMTTYTVSEGMLVPLSIEGEPITEAEEESESEEPEEGESFGAAIEKRMGGMS